MSRRKPVSLIILIFLLAMFLSYHLYYYVQNTINSKQVDNYIIENNYNDSKPTILNSREEYLGVLRIPKIHLEKGFYNIDSKKNNVNQNITLLKESDMPDKKGGVVALAAHRGNSPVSYFNNLYQLALDDEIIIYYHDYKYTYVVNKIYKENKNGYIHVDKNVHENYLVLTTCSKGENKQLIVTAKLLKQEKAK